MLSARELSAQDVIRLLDLKPHPEGGHFRETFRDPRTVEGGRAASTAIYFLLARGERSHWHRVDAVETLALVRRRAADAADPRRQRRSRSHAARPRSRRRRAPAGGRAGARLAGGREPRRLDARRLHGRAGLSSSRASSWRRRTGRRASAPRSSSTSCVSAGVMCLSAGSVSAPTISADHELGRDRRAPDRGRRQAGISSIMRAAARSRPCRAPATRQSSAQ